MLLSNPCMYGLRASVYLASKNEENYISIKKISGQLDISTHFLTKVLQHLTAANLLESLKGPNGGVRLKKPADKISPLDVVLAIDGEKIFTECVLGLPGCGHEKPCPMHNEWADLRSNIKKMLEESSLQEMAQKGKNGNLRISPGGEFRWE